MPALFWYRCVLLLSAAGCGRLGVQLRDLDADAGVQGMDASQPRDSGRPLAGRAPEGGSQSGVGGGAGLAAGTSSAPLDAGRPYQGNDAATMGGPDAASTLDAGTPASCGGELLFGLCWYLAAADTSCTSECTNKGGFDSRTLAYVGTQSQGGSRAECSQVMAALGRPGTVAEGTQQIGIGCHEWEGRDLWWLQSPAFDPNAATPQGTGARIACACQR